MDSRRSPQRLARLISRISRRISNGTVGRPQRRRGFPAPIRSEARAVPSYNSVRLNDRKRTTGLSEQHVKTNENQSVNWVESELARRPRRSTLICCLKTKISASSVARDRKRSVNIRQISLHRSNITQQHHPILNQLPAGYGLR